ncbi:MAG: NADH-quinone oxidoreductase subunit J [Cyanobacteria bacterium HKST-UBA06]|nr:NADH-quinone oxidoreductase subunit J [Cyanobacteria bacterium HKST-UBA05]MCA9807556.1 NADH-quinone oxidoreductase subunit J [Cyanobacteria bacterium HKST-UBA06]
MIETSPLLQQLAFWILAAVMLASAIGIVFHRSIVYSALFMLVAFMAIAGVFALLNAPFLAAAQIMVYGVGLTIVMIFGIMLTGDQPFRDPAGKERSVWYALLPLAVVAGLGGVLSLAILKPAASLNATNGLFVAQQTADFWQTALQTLPGAQALLEDGGLSHIAMLLFSKYLLAFELASVLLLLAMVGAILLALRTFPEEEQGAVAGGALQADGATKALSAGAGSVAGAGQAAKEVVQSAAGAK